MGVAADRFASAGARPSVSVTVGDRTKRTEIADWIAETGEWRVGETLTLEVRPEDEICLSASCSDQYDFFVAAVSLRSREVGESYIPVHSAAAKLSMEDRDIDGIVYVSPHIGFDLRERQSGKITARVLLTFETMQPPPKMPHAQESDAAGPWCNIVAAETVLPGNTGCYVDEGRRCSSFEALPCASERAASERVPPIPRNGVMRQHL